MHLSTVMGVVLGVALVFFLEHKATSPEEKPFGSDVKIVTSKWSGRILCIDGVTYYSTTRALTVAYDKDTLLPRRCDSTLSK